MSQHSILAIDIGGGTQDVLLYDPEEPMENAVKLVLPSPTVIVARRIRRATRDKAALFLSGRVMGGGSSSRAIQAHLKAGLPVYSLKEPALTLHDNLEKVRALGIEIVDENPGNGAVNIPFGDVNLDLLARSLAHFEVQLPKVTALAIQDHGFSPQASNRLTRFKQWQRFLDGGGDVELLLFSEPPPELSRWRAASESAPGAFFMDTGSAALRGAMLDEFAAPRLRDGITIVNAGNEHTVAFLVRERRVWGVYEHHTSLLDPKKLADHLERFTKGTLPHDEIFEDWGHGVAYQPGYSDLGPFATLVITGPRREIARGLGRMAAPFGEMMLSGCFGLIEAVRERQVDRGR